LLGHAVSRGGVPAWETVPCLSRWDRWPSAVSYAGMTPIRFNGLGGEALSALDSHPRHPDKRVDSRPRNVARATVAASGAGRFRFVAARLRVWPRARTMGGIDTLRRLR